MTQHVTASPAHVMPRQNVGAHCFRMWAGSWLYRVYVVYLRFHKRKTSGKQYGYHYFGGLFPSELTYVRPGRVAMVVMWEIRGKKMPSRGIRNAKHRKPCQEYLYIYTYKPQNNHQRKGTSHKEKITCLDVYVHVYVFLKARDNVICLLRC